MDTSIKEIMQERETISEIFEDCVKKFPLNIALKDSQKSVTYEQLNNQANQMAHTITEKTNKAVKNGVIGIFMEKSMDSIVAMLGIMKAGFAYVPIDVSYPKERIDYIIENSRLEVMISSSTYLSHPSLKDTLVINCKEDLLNNVDNLQQQAKKEDLAYVIYTSGTTGNPKGVMVAHSNVIGLVRNTADLFDFSQKDKWSLFHSFCFDFSVWEIYGALLYGGCGILIDVEDARNPLKTVELLKEHQVTVLNQVPSSFYNIAEAADVLKQDLVDLRYVIFGGEGLKPKKLTSFHKKYPSVQLINMYGITEITVHGTYKEITQAEIAANDSNIGKALPGLQFNIIDSETGEAVSDGEIGEIIVSGYGVAQGYMNKPELTQERFAIDSVSGQQLYYSGDLGRKNKAGEIIYSGRKDNQVQLRGFRVELSEIEAALMKLEGILDAVVLVEEGQAENDELLAFFIPETHAEFTVKGIRKALQEMIPSYMLPYHFIPVKSIPLTANGKYDRRRLLERKHRTLKNEVEDIKLPETTIEKKVLTELSAIIQVPIKNLMANFFEIGGDSLKAAKLINILKQDGYSVTIEDLFQSENLATFISKMELEDTTDLTSTISEEHQKFTISNAEKRIFSASMGTPAGLYDIVTTIQFNGPLNVIKLEQAINQVLSNHDIFSIKYRMVGDELLKEKTEIQPVTLSPLELPKAGLEQSLEQYCPKFMPDQYPLYDFKLFSHQAKEATLLLNIHHIIFDGISQQIFLNEVLEQYEQGKMEELAATSYQQFVHTEAGFTKSESYEAMKNYWKQKAALVDSREEITKDFPRPQKRRYQGQTIYHLLEKDLVKRLKQSCKELKISSSMFTQGVFHLLLARLTGMEEVVTGTIASGRTETKFEKSVGMFVNTLPFVSNADRTKKIRTYFSEVRTSMSELLSNQKYPLDRIIKDLELPFSNDRNPLFDYMFIYQNVRENKTIELREGIQVLFDSIQKEPAFAKFDLTMEVFEAGEEVLVKLNYDKALFEEAKMTAFIELYKNTLRSVSEQLDNQIQDINILSEADKEQITESFNTTYTDTTEEQRELGEYISDKLRKYPKKKAVICDGKSLSFEQVDKISNYYAREITKKGIGNNDIVGILLPRSVALYAAMLAVVKSGAGLLLIDPSLPENRKKYIIEDSQCVLLITDDETKSFEQGVEKLCLPTNLDELGVDAQPYFVRRRKEDLSYVIYTSGTTGNPKGVKLKSNSAVNMSDFLMKQFRIRNSVYLTVAAVTFDMFVLDFFVSLAMEATFVLPTEEERIDNYLIASLMDQEQVEATIITPTRLDSLVDDYPEQMKSLKIVLCGGENLQFSTSKKVLTRTKARLFNFYGPSETSVYCSGKEIIDEQDITIGVPAAFSKVYVVDDFNNLMPIGYEGELCVGGKSVGKGYIGKEKLTSEKFMKNPFHEGVMYRTGDHAVYRADGELIYKGRRDHQVKLNGFRIELQEIENALLSITNIVAAHVQLSKRENAAGELRGFVIGDVSLEAVKAELESQLPYYMVPKLVKTATFPMTRNGKIDGAALDNLFDEEYQEIRSQAKEAKSEIEKVLLSAYRQILSKSDLGVTDNFFYNGGDSIKAIQLVSILRKAKIDVTVTQIMDHTDVRSLAPVVKQLENKPMKKSYDETKAFPLTPIQEFYFSKNELNEENFHQSMIIEASEAIDKRIAEECFTEIIAHHAALRTRFRKEATSVVAEYLSPKNISFVIEEYVGVHDSLEDELDHVDEQNQRRISLKENHLLSVSLLRTPTKEYLVIGVHHLVVDGLSLRILLKDFTELYSAKLSGTVYEMLESDSTLTWSNYWLENNHEQSMMADIEYWTSVEEKVKAAQESLTSPKDFRTNEATHILSKEITQKLLSDIHIKYNTNVQDLLFTAFVMTFNKEESKDLVVMMEGHGRETEGTELMISNTIGWFTTLFPVVFSIKDAGDIHLTLREVKDTILGIPKHGFSYGVLKYLSSVKVKEEIGFSYNEKPCLAFNFMGEMKAEAAGAFTIKPKHETYDISEKVNLTIGLTYNLTIVEETLVIAAIYNESLYEASAVLETLKKFTYHLENILTFLDQSDEGQVLSAGEFEESGLSNEELDELLAYISL